MGAAHVTYDNGLIQKNAKRPVRTNRHGLDKSVPMPDPLVAYPSPATADDVLYGCVPKSASSHFNTPFTG